VDPDDHEKGEGMTSEDKRFWAAALICAGDEAGETCAWGSVEGQAEYAVRMADALLAELGRDEAAQDAG
jgi:hypothetical protein